MPKLSHSQRAVVDYMRRSGDNLMVWRSNGFVAGHSSFGEKWGHYSRGKEMPKPSMSTIRAMVRLGCFIEVDRANSDATSSGKDASVRYRVNPDLKVE